VIGEEDGGINKGESLDVSKGLDAVELR